MPEQLDPSAAAPEQPYGPGAICDDCGHFAERHDPQGCHFPRPDAACCCAGMLWLGTRWPRPWLPAPEGLVNA
jgi:hypothetical protein